jgi:Berberine and berberine like
LPLTLGVRDYSDMTAPHSDAGGYINFMAADDQGRVSDNYGANYERLLSIKRKYDRGNLFHVNQRPEARGAIGHAEHADPVQPGAAPAPC